jgi:membrane protease YdiL (CAAX protease family)
MAVVIWYTGHQPDFRSYYSGLVGGRPPLQLVYDTGIAMFAWEFFYRGWLLEAFGRKYGTDAIWLQMMPFALLHVGKPEIELLSTVLGGAFFGILAWRTRSMLYGWLLHWFMMVWILLVVSSQM